jgi:ADP-ribose pyrophosphatase
MVYISHMTNPLPENAQKVFEGVIFDIHQWEQELFDGTKRTFEAATRQSIVIMIPVVGDKIFVAKEEQPGRPPYFAVPAGFSEKSDKEPLDAAKRELKEETGLTSDDWELLDTYSLYPRMSVTDYIYVARNCQKTHEKKLDSGERQLEEHLYTFDEFIDLHDHEDFANFFLKHNLIHAKYDPMFKKELRKKLFG